MGIGALVGAGISGAASLFGASESADAAKEAAKAQVQAAQIAQQTQEQMFGQAKNALQPYMDLGNGAATQLGNRLTDLTSSIAPPTMTQADLESTPGYQFTLGQGLKSTQNNAAARGLGVSGAALKGAASYATGLSDNTYNTRFTQAQQQWQDAVTNRNDAYNKLIGTTQVGQGAAGALAGQAIQTGQGIANTQTNAGNAQAAGINAAGQATAAGAAGVGSAFNNALSQYMVGNALQGNKGLFG
jgi:gas vesicle protein